MPNFVAIEFCEDKLLIACAKSAGRQFQVTHLLELDAGDSSSEEELGESLKSILADAGVTRAELIGIVGRDQSEVREMTVPPVPDNELPDLVRFQARNVFASLNDSWQLDFVPFECKKESQQRVLAAAIGPQVLERFESLAAATALKLKRIVFRPFALTHLFEAHLSGDNSRLLVMPSGGQIDLVVATQDKLVAARSFRSNAEHDPDAVAGQLLGETRRTIASTKRSLCDDPVDKIIIGANKQAWGSVESRLATQTNLPVAFADPIRCLSSDSLAAPHIPNESERFAGLLGAFVREYSGDKQVVDFLNPRKPIVKKRNYKRMLIPVALAALLFLFAGVFGWITLNNQAKMMEKKQTKLNELRDLNQGNGNSPGVEMKIGEVDGLDKWQAGKVNWLDELAWISEKMLTADDIIISKFTGKEQKGRFAIDLSSKMTEATSEDTTWKDAFNERYVHQFKETTTDTSNKDYPRARPFSLVRQNDLEETIDVVSEIAFLNRDQEELESSNITSEPVETTSTDD